MEIKQFKGVGTCSKYMNVWNLMDQISLFFSLFVNIGITAKWE